MPPWCGRVGGVVLLVLGAGLAGCGFVTVTAKPTPSPQGADPVAWVGAFCMGFTEVVAAQNQAATTAPTPQGHKDVLIKLADATQQAFTTTARKLTQLGPPAIANGKQAQDSVLGFFTTAAAAVGDRRARLAALDPNDPDFAQKAAHLPGPDLSAAASQMQTVASNKELAPAFSAAPECQRLTR
ncbi:MAG: hypothetical protein JO296_10250 [Pseudonocardiales bacterium]|nr:hypothetical protein [Pseudonocardiales bacterium]MBV9650508.1 hypothetical protein [Pseudonocardiales bacterium]